MAAILLALSASLTVGAADFVAGLLSRRMSIALVLLGVEGFGIAPVLLAVALSGDSSPGTHHALAAALAGLSGAAGLACFYRGLAVGTMSIVAPISATGVVLAVVVGLATGDRPGGAQVVGLVVTFAGILLVSRERSDDAAVQRASRAALGFALLSALGFGGYFIASDVAADGGVPWALLVSRCAAVVPVIVVVAATATRGLVRPDRRMLLALVGVGLLDVTAAALFALANTRGLVSVVSVIAAMYPVATILLARAVLHERVDRMQGAGIATAMVGVALIAAG